MKGNRKMYVITSSLNVIKVRHRFCKSCDPYDIEDVLQFVWKKSSLIDGKNYTYKRYYNVKPSVFNS